jgi:hypothetical protein
MVLSLLKEEVMAASLNHEEVENGAAELVSALLIGLLMLAGSVCLYEGLGADLGILGHGALKTYAFPVGAGLLVLALLMARFSIFDRRQKSRRGGASSPGPPPNLAGNDAAGTAPNSASSKEQAGAGHDKRAA